MNTRPSWSSVALALSGAALVWCSVGIGVPATAMAQDAPAAAAAAQPVLNPRHPERYVVQRGDTLWGISAMFLRDPWYWPEIWYANPQVENPHLIYPGDELTLVYVNGKPQLQLQRGADASVRGASEKLSPRVREQALAEAIPTIPLEVIGAFLGRGSVLQKDELNRAPYVVAIRDGHLMGATGNDLYVRGDIGGEGYGYTVVHPGERLVDPDDGDVLGYQGIYAGYGTITRTGDPATLTLGDSAREVLEGDRLIDRSVVYPAYFTPRAPAQPIDGSIIAVVDGVSQVSQFQVIIINRGTRDGLEAGHVLRVWQAGDKIRDRVRTGLSSRKVRLPDEPAGISMVFRTYDRVSYALVLEATSEIHVMDAVRNPD